MKWFNYKRIQLVFLMICSVLQALRDGDKEMQTEDYVKVRAVFLNCEPEDRDNVSPDNEARRFEREELFKHSALRDCDKKLAVTVKIASVPNQSFGDEYLPIEHVFEGTKMKRLRLLNPYVLRLRREPPLQVYKLHKLDTVSGILTSSDQEFEEKYRRRSARTQRNLIYSKQEWALNVTPATIAKITNGWANIPIKCTYQDTVSKLRNKRNEHNVLIEDAIDDKHSQWIPKKQFYQSLHRDLEASDDVEESPTNNVVVNHKGGTFLDKKHLHSDHPKNQRKHSYNLRNTYLKENVNNKNVLESGDDNRGSNLKDIPTPKKVSIKVGKTAIRASMKRFVDESTKRKIFNVDDINAEEKDYDVYEIGNPELWYNAHLQLFEKLSTSEGKTLWNDLTKGEQASVSSLSPEWMGQDLNVRYRADEWLSRDQYSLPNARLCLLVPLLNGNTNIFIDSDTDLSDDFIVVPFEDIVGWEGDVDILDIRNDNYSDSESSTFSTETSDQGNRRVIIRTAQALLKDSEDKLNIASHGSDRYLTLPHRRLHHAQIDLEARANENELVRDGASARISTAVSDSTRHARTVITVQAANMGLAAARFRTVVRDCSPALFNLMNEMDNAGSVSSPVLFPPRHTRNLRLEFTTEIPVDSAHCTVALLNDNEDTVAVRDVAIKRGDRCFCVWHCDCVCLSEDSKLLCREMAEARQAAAGLAIRDRGRRSRSICYPDNTTTNVVVVIIGVLSILLLLGFVKACFGVVFRRVGTWGLDWLLRMPRKLDCYYERSLACRTIEYDEQGWPIHPDTKKRTVHLVSWPMEFLLNMILFVCLPCVLIQEAIYKCFVRCTHSDRQQGEECKKNDNKKCFSSQDLQGARGRWRRRRGGLRRWMTPEAQNLSTDIWQKGLTPKPVLINKTMQPLLLKSHGGDIVTEAHDSGPDSEQDDTHYVLTQMQKSRESLTVR